jgi:RNA polymerase sigma-70 factor (ECF subfamily)
MERDPSGHSPSGMQESTQPALAEPPSVSSGTLDVRQLFESHLAFVWRNLRRLGVPEPLLEDATQDVFLVVHRRREAWSAALSTVETWLFGIVVRVARNYRRAQKRLLARLSAESDSQAAREARAGEDGPAEAVARREAVAIFERAIASLDEDRRAVFLLVDVEQLAVTQVAEALGININTAYWRLRKARLDFRRALLRAQGQSLDRGNRS